MVRCSLISAASTWALSGPDSARSGLSRRNHSAERCWQRISPETELLNDVHYCGRHNLRAVDVITAGFPCQDLSVAGKRAGLAGARSGLFWQVVRILGECRPPWFVLENVPGLFSSNEGRDFGVVLNELDDLGYGLAWRVLDSQYFGVAQRRRRVFIVGRFGAPCPAEVLFESEGGSGDFAKSGETRQDVADETGECVTAFKRRGGFGWSESSDVSATLESTGGSHQGGSELTPLVACLNSGGTGGGFRIEPGEHIVIQGSGTSMGQRGGGWRQNGPCYTLNGVDEHAVAFGIYDEPTPKIAEGIMPTLRNREHGGGVMQFAAYECSPPDSERMRDFTELPEGMDSARYRALGNAITQEVAYWIANRIAALMPCLPEVKLHPVIGLEEK